MSTCTMARGAEGLAGGSRTGPPVMLGPVKTDLGSDPGQGGDDERDVPVQLDAQLGGAPVDIVAIDGARESLVPQLLAHGADLQAADDPARPHQRAGMDEAGKLIARVERPVDPGDPGHPG